MNNKLSEKGLQPFEKWVVVIGFLLSGIVIVVTGVSYLLHSPFSIRLLVWLIGVAFIAVGIICLEWLRATFGTAVEPSRVGVRHFLILAIPLAFIIDSQLCGLGFKACTVLCNVLLFSLIGLSIIIVIQLYRRKPIGVFLAAMVVLSVVPHCVCSAPINVIWHNIFSGYAPTCFIMPLAATLFSVSALRGIRPRLSTLLVILMLVVIAFIAVGNPLFGFPWEGCVG